MTEFAQRLKGKPWHVRMKLDPATICICKMYGQEPEDFVRHVLREYITDHVKEWANLETFALQFEVRSNPQWRKIAEEADDWKDFVRLASADYIEETRGGIPLKTNKVSRKKMDILIRGIRRLPDGKGLHGTEDSVLRAAELDQKEEG